MKQRDRKVQTARGKGRVAFTYYRSAQSGESKASFKKKKKNVTGLKKFLIRTADTIVIILILVTVGYSLMINSQPAVAITDTSYRPSKVYRDAAAEQFKTLGNRSKMTVDERSIEKKLIARFPEIQGVALELPFLGQTATLRLQIAAPSIYLKTDSGVHIIDSTGKVIGRPSDFPAIKNLPTIEDKSGFQIEAGQQVLSVYSMDFIRTLLQQLKEASVPVRSVVLPPEAMEVNLFTTDNSYFVKFHLGGDSLQQAGQFLAARAEFKKKGIKPTDYLDVRVAGKVFYK